MIVRRQRAIGGAVRGWGVGQVDMECQGSVRYSMLAMWVCGGCEE